MQTYSQTFAAATTWELNLPGKYFTTLECTQPVNVRFYQGGKMLDLGEIRGLMSGLEVTLGDINSQAAAFDRVQIDVAAGDTVKVGIGNGQARYNRGAATVTVQSMPGVTIAAAKVPQAAFTNTQRTATNTSAQMLGANAARQYLMVQNKSATGTLYLSFGAAATVANGVRVVPGGAYELVGIVATNAVHAIGDIANNPDIVTVEG